MTEPAPSPRPPVPVRLAHAPLSQGLVVPHITLAHRDRTRPVWGKLDQRRLRDTLWRRLCQICGQPLHDRVVLYIRPADHLRGIAPEPGVHPECGYYSRQACPMLAGRQTRYNPHPPETFTRCEDPDCACHRWQANERDAREAPREGQPADAWYEVWIRLSDYAVIDDPGTDTTPPVVGVNLRGVKLLKIRKVRDAAPAADPTSRPIDLLRAHLAFAAIFGYGGLRL
ncbi:cell envelope biogenesis protein OmpA [Nocardia gipuzkoensis]|uniref:cell envelope biogenesis protein OmpA n=1 Tax=Nocardia gipuzkoensis TaxID=2749991 RepID=UPI0015EEFCDD|nr:cell envelope biogenesis protein OmpA [Nocardia gipuzkoensis]